MTPAAHQLLNDALALAHRLRHLPESTYRLQFHKDFTFRDATRIIPYLAKLGITHVYCSPYLKARPGSTHGYDVIDHCSLNPELGTQADYDTFLRALKDHNLSHILDTVPNHVGVGTNHNPWWNDVLENGPASVYGHFFDIAWRASPRPELHDKVLLPLLGSPYAQTLEKGELQLIPARGAFWVTYYDRQFPISPRTYPRILSHNLDALRQQLDPRDPALMEYLSILSAARNLPDRSDATPEQVEERHREKEVIKRRLRDLATNNPTIARHLRATIEVFNGIPGNPRSFDLLDDLLAHQCYRLADWHVAPDEINYRRFFDINDLAALAMERQDVFDATMSFTLSLCAAGHVTGLRIDHPDGLYDPAQYLHRLQSRYLLALAQTLYKGDNWPAMRQELLTLLQTPSAFQNSEFSIQNSPPLYVTVEKILAPHEPLPADWPVAGTSGYDPLNEINGLFIDPTGEQPLTGLYQSFTNDTTPFDDLVYQKKLLILDISLASELHMLAHQLDRIAQQDRRSRDFTFLGLHAALRQLVACFPVYRTYITDAGPHASDRPVVELATTRAIQRNPKTDPALFHFIRDVLLLNNSAHLPDDAKHAHLRFAGKFQQLTAPTTAKGIEDTAFYIYQRLISLNEVGGDPTRFGVPPHDLHTYLTHRAKHHPHALTPLSTHDTKRSEDVRARLNVLSELPDEWRTQVEQWSDLTSKFKHDHTIAPDEEYLLYQTLLGAWPSSEPHVGAASAAGLSPSPGTPGEGRGEGSAPPAPDFIQRIQSYMQKALRESKLRTSWTSPNEAHESAVSNFISSILTSPDFLSSFLPFQQKIAHFGLLNSLSQTALRLTAPGVPDTYQGTELLDLSLVDPDNRRPVDYQRREQLLSRLPHNPTLPDTDPDTLKLLITTRLLHARRQHPGLFTTGTYTPLIPTGPLAHHLFAFTRQHQSTTAVVILPRLPTKLPNPPLGPAWQDTTLPLPTNRPLHNLLTNHPAPATTRVADLLTTLPLAVLLTT